MLECPLSDSIRKKFQSLFWGCSIREFQFSLHWAVSCDSSLNLQDIHQVFEDSYSHKGRIIFSEEPSFST